MNSLRWIARPATCFAFSVTVSTTTSRAAAFCEEKDSLPKDKDGNIEWSKALSNQQPFWDALAQHAGSGVQGVIDSGVPTQLSYGFISGWCSGFALKKAGKVVASVIGFGFVVLQTLAYNGYIQVDHVKIKSDVEDMLDLNNDGKIDKEDGQLAYTKLMKVLEFNLPGGTGFVAGFLGGVRSG